MSNQKIVDYPLGYYSMVDAINSEIKGKNIFILANEKKNKSGKIGRYYVVFRKFKHFLLNRQKFPHCHEILIDHKNNKPDIRGRLVFDFDIHSKNIPENFKNDIEYTILDVIENYYNNVNIEKIEFIWSSSKNPKKFSKHLTVKNFYFDNWIYLSKIFYKLFCISWDNKNDWISSNDLIDAQIIKKKTSLRMVGSKKIGGHILKLDNSKHILTDSLIRIYSKNERKNEQLITIKNINQGVFTNVLEISNITEQYKENYHKVITNSIIDRVDPQYPEIAYQLAYQLLNCISPGIYRQHKIDKDRLKLLRNRPHYCLLSSRYHEHENASLSLFNISPFLYKVNFYCYRKCGIIKSVMIGHVNIENEDYIIEYNRNRVLNTNIKNL